MKNKFSLIVSILFHLLLFLLAWHIFDQDRVILHLQDNFLPTETKGYSVEMITLPDTSTTSSNNAEVNANNHATINRRVRFSHAAHAEINFQAVNSKTKLQRRPKPMHEVNKAKTLPASAQHMTAEHQSLAATRGIIITQPRHAITPVASSPVIDMSQLGAGDTINSSTDGTGTKAGKFDLRVIEYGQDAAYAINQNIVVPEAYRYVHVTYRAFVELNRNMQFQSMQMVKSTGDAQFDANIAQALRETIYPPLPPGADWQQFHNIDFTIK